MSLHVDDDDLEGQQNQDLPWVTKILTTPVGVGLVRIANSSENVTPRLWFTSHKMSCCRNAHIVVSFQFKYFLSRPFISLFVSGIYFMQS